MTINHYSPLQVFFRGDEVQHGGKTYICAVQFPIHSCINVPPTNTKYWRLKPMTIDERLAEQHLIRTKGMQDHELLRPILSPEEWDEDFLKAVKKELLTRQTQ